MRTDKQAVEALAAAIELGDEHDVAAAATLRDLLRERDDLDMAAGLEKQDMENLEAARDAALADNLRLRAALEAVERLSEFAEKLTVNDGPVGENYLPGGMQLSIIRARVRAALASPAPAPTVEEIAKWLESQGEISAAIRLRKRK